jgi:MGT family glycosyltransferase
MTMPKRFLFAITDGGGTVPADTSVIRALVRRGHDVRVLADRVLATDVEATGAEHIVWATAPQRPDLAPQSVVVRDWDARTPLGAFARARDGLMIGPADRFAADVRAELRRRPADVVVANLFLFGAQVAAEAEGVPVAMLSPSLLSLPGWGCPPLGPGFPPAGGPLGRARDAAVGMVISRSFDRSLRTLNAVRAENGLGPIDSVLSTYERADRLLILTSRAFDYDCFRPSANVRVTGPRLDDPAWAGDWTPPPGDEPLVLVGMSSTYMAHGEILQRVTTALGELPIRGLVTTGPAIAPDSITAPSNVTVVERAPHSQVLRQAAAVVTHGGHGTVIKTLAAGVPLVVLPFGRDQADNAARVAHHRAGIRLSRGARAAAITTAVRRVLDDPAYAAGAQRLAAAIAEDLRSDRAVGELEALADSNPAGDVRGARRSAKVLA